MKKYTTYTRKYKDQADCKNFGKQFDSMFDSMGEMFSSMSSMFNTVGESSITEEDNKTVIKKDGKTYVIDKDGKVTVNGKQMVEMSDKPYNPYNYTAADCKVEKVHENTTKFDWHMFWGFVLSCSLAILISCLICK
jgi:hypothetical protein